MAGLLKENSDGVSAFFPPLASFQGVMESAAEAACSLLCPGAFWQRVSGPQEEQLLKQMSYALVGLISVTVVFLLRRAGAPYGRYASASYGYPVPATLAWMVQEAPAFLFPGMLVLCSGGSRLSFGPNRFLLGLFLVHYFYRSFIFPFLIRGGKSTPFFVFVSAFIFCSYNGYLQGRSLSNYAEYSSNWLTEPRFILGIAAWLGGLLINMHSDYILRNLRKPGETEYKIPRGLACRGGRPALTSLLPPPMAQPSLPGEGAGGASRGVVLVGAEERRSGRAQATESGAFQRRQLPSSLACVFLGLGSFAPARAVFLLAFPVPSPGSDGVGSRAEGREG